MRAAALALFAVVILSAPLAAQDRQQTLADIRQELTVLHVEIQRLKREMSTTGAPVANLSDTGVLDRVAAIEAELQRLTAQTEQMGHRIDRIVADGTNRIGDLEFRLVELEGGDVGKLGQTSTLGGDAGNPAPAVAPPAGSNGTASELAVGEQADFDAARQALSDGDNARAATLFAQFTQSYPGSPLAPLADLSRGKALDGIGDTREAARAYLASFTADSTGQTAPVALFELGAALGRLGQHDQACITLGEVEARFPGADSVANARQQMATLGCS
jgi:tol-pal system protein YbgF